MPLETVPNVLLSIEPEHAEAILDGEKRWEYRRVAPACGPPYRLVLYATAPVQAAVGACWVPFVYSRYPTSLVLLTVEETPSDPDDVLSYFRNDDGAYVREGHALRVMGARRFDSPLSRKQLEGAALDPSQNFRYLPDVDPGHVEVEGVRV